MGIFTLDGNSPFTDSRFYIHITLFNGAKMITTDTKNFWRYMWHKELNIFKFIKKPIFYEVISALVLILIITNKNTSGRIKVLAIILFFAMLVAFNFYSLYKSGAHRFWVREKVGRVSRDKIKELKEQRRNNNKPVEEKEEVVEKEIEFFKDEVKNTSPDR